MNKRAAIALAERINEMTNALVILEEDSKLELDWDKSLTLLSFQQALSEVHNTMQLLSRNSYLSQVLHERKDREKLLDLTERVGRAFDVVMTQGGTQGASQHPGRGACQRSGRDETQTGRAAPGARRDARRTSGAHSA